MMRFLRVGLGYLATWDAGGVEIALRHVKRRSDGLHGEINVSAAVVERRGGKLHRALCNVSSTSARDRLAKILAQEAAAPDTKGKPLPWADMIEEFCSAVLEAEDRGEPIERIGGSTTEPLPLEYRVSPLIPEGETAIIYGPGGTGKSYLACLLAVAVQTGHGAAGWRVRRGNVLYLDWEAGKRATERRVRRVAAGLGVTGAEIAYRHCRLPIAVMAEDLAARVSTDNIGLVIVDSVGIASGTSREGGDANESAIRLFEAVGMLNTSVLLIDHVTGDDVKAGKDAVQKPYGSIYKVNLARSTWELRAGQTDDFGLHLALYHRKVNDEERLREPFGIYVQHGLDAVTFESEDIGADLATWMTFRARIIRELSKGAMTGPDLAIATGIPPDSLRVYLNRKMAGQVQRNPDDGKWGLMVRNPQQNRVPVAA